MLYIFEVLENNPRKRQRYDFRWLLPPREVPPKEVTPKKVPPTREALSKKTRIITKTTSHTTSSANWTLFLQAYKGY